MTSSPSKWRYSQTLARQTFRELTPVLQQEYLGGPIYIGNPDLQMSRLKNYDLRLDYAPYEGGLVSLSGFYKDLIDPIENVQFNQNTGNYTTPVNFPSGMMRRDRIRSAAGSGHASRNSRILDRWQSDLDRLEGRF